MLSKFVTKGLFFVIKLVIFEIFRRLKYVMVWKLALLPSRDEKRKGSYSTGSLRERKLVSNTGYETGSKQHIFCYRQISHVGSRDASGNQNIRDVHWRQISSATAESEDNL
jgi:hypothetical protein